MFFKNAHFILAVGDSQATLMRGKGLEIDKSWSIKTLVELQQLLAGPSTLTVLINTSEQKVHREQLPNLTYFDRRSFLQQLFKNRYEANNFIGHFAVEKTSLHMTVITVERTPALESWLTALKETKVRIKGIYALPVEAFKLARQHLPDLHHLNAWILLITRHGGNNSRHAVFYRQKLVFTRLIVLKSRPDDAQHLAGELEASARASLAYLQRLPKAGDDSIHLVCFDDIEVLAHLPSAWAGVSSCALIPFAAREGDLLHAQAFIKAKSPLVPLKSGSSAHSRRVTYGRPLRYVTTITALGGALSLSDYRPSSLPKVSLKVKAQPILAERRISKDMSRLKNAPYLELKGVVYLGPQHWTIWLNGKRLTPQNLDPDVTIHKLTPSEISCTWHHATRNHTIILGLNKRYYIASVKEIDN